MKSTKGRTPAKSEEPTVHPCEYGVSGHCKVGKHAHCYSSIEPSWVVESESFVDGTLHVWRCPCVCHEPFKCPCGRGSVVIASEDVQLGLFG